MLLQPVWSLVSPAIVILCLDKRLHDWQRKLGQKRMKFDNISYCTQMLLQYYHIYYHFLMTNLLSLHSTATYYVFGVIDGMNRGVTRHLSHEMGRDKIMSSWVWDLTVCVKEKCFASTSAGWHLSRLTSHDSLQTLWQKIS